MDLKCDIAVIDAGTAGLAAERLSAAQDRISAMLHLGRDRDAAEELAGLLAANPLAEPIAGMLMVALCRSGRKADALQAPKPEHIQLRFEGRRIFTDLQFRPRLEGLFYLFIERIAFPGAPFT